MPPVAMPSLTLPDRLIWFAHCPKAGGTSVEQFMVARWGDAVGHLHWGWDRWWRSGGWRLAAPPNSPQHLVWEDAVSALPRAPDAVFAVVRDPVARMTSEYRWQRGGQCRSWLGRLMA
ncbi:MAG: sulfotransferase family protein, partial [Paracoccaceae bacterium]|nr:sulfotransferase family protein [Paracoccaceae bacterium]